MKFLRNLFILFGVLLVLTFLADINQPQNLNEFSSTETTITQNIQNNKTQKTIPPTNKIEKNTKNEITPKIILEKSPTTNTEFNTQLIILVNAERVKVGLNTLIPNSALNKAAQLKVADMVENNYFAHTSPTGKTAAQFRIEGGYNGYLFGENLAVLFKTAPEIMAAWMNSPTHKANILQPDYKDVGVATAFTVYKGQNTFFVAMEFGARN